MWGLPSGLSLHQPLLDEYQTELVIFLLHMKNEFCSHHLQSPPELWRGSTQSRSSVPLQPHGLNKASIYSFNRHMFIVKQKNKIRASHSTRGQTVTSSFVQVFPRWTLFFFWSTSSGRAVTDEVISCLFWSDLRDRLQMCGQRDRVSHEKR